MTTAMRRLSLPLICLAAILMFASCESVKRFLSRDLEEEDYSLGELYVDEYVKEVTTLRQRQRPRHRARPRR